MGHQKIDKTKVQLGNLKGIFFRMINVTEAILRYQMALTESEEERKGLKKYINETKKAYDIVTKVTHLDILESLYRTFIANKEIYFMSLVAMTTNKNTIVKWDRTEKGHKLFLELEKQAKEDYQKKLEEMKSNQDLIKKAKEEGKKVEMVLINGKLQPRIVEEKAN